MPITTIPPQDADKAMAKGATLVDIRGADEHAREHIAGAIHVPLTRLNELPKVAGPIIFHCKSGMRTQANEAALQAAAASVPCHILEGGLDGWRAAGLPTRLDRKQPLEIMRQVQMAAGGLVLLGVLLGFLVAPVFFSLSAFVGAGLMMAGATGWCGMAKLLQLMPWNRPFPGA
ncbi:rhodanese-like domain-containing protein [Sphingobium sp. EM0848]|uniref:rhodanese-like domain-containing protein n=1 Tax=Sphingobium sp. EM0848 TaxID=2743473 RepID=UPI00159C14F1|nr:rhodanese-like domain-containing protein [Sphingobium sp. EM0848]